MAPTYIGYVTIPGQASQTTHAGLRNDLIQISPAPLPDQERFFAGWIALLRKEKGDEADAWLREAIRLALGTQGLEELALAEGRKRPHAYLDWFTALKAEGKYRDVFAAAQTALKTLPAKLPIRAAIADHLCAAATRLEEVEALHAGRWEAFSVAPTLPRLLDLWETALHGAARWRAATSRSPTHSNPKWISPLVSILPGQLFAMSLATVKELDAEHPRTIRKVTETL